MNLVVSNEPTTVNMAKTEEKKEEEETVEETNEENTKEIMLESTNNETTKNVVNQEDQEINKPKPTKQPSSGKISIRMLGMAWVNCSPLLVGFWIF